MAHLSKEELDKRVEAKLQAYMELWEQQSNKTPHPVNLVERLEREVIAEHEEEHKPKKVIETPKKKKAVKKN